MSEWINKIKKNWAKRKHIQAWKHKIDLQCGYSSCTLCYRPPEEPGELREEVEITHDYSLLKDPEED